MPAVVTRISLAPVKGLGLVHPGSVVVAAYGVPGDRRYAMLDERGVLANGKRFGPLVRVHPLWSDDPDELVLTLPDGSTVGGRVVLGAAVEGVFYGSPRAGRLVEGEYAEALSRLAGETLRLIRLPDGDGVDRTGDGAVTLQSQASLAAAAADGGLEQPLDGRRFRMTFTVDGVPAYAEDGWLGRRVRLGGTVVRPAGNVGRCAVTTQDPDTGVKTFDTLKVLAATRTEVPTTEALPFGVHAEVVTPGRVSVGDEVVLEG